MQKQQIPNPDQQTPNPDRKRDPNDIERAPGRNDAPHERAPGRNDAPHERDRDPLKQPGDVPDVKPDVIAEHQRGQAAGQGQQRRKQ
jgi:hypothetical protein